MQHLRLAYFLLFTFTFLQYEYEHFHEIYKTDGIKRHEKIRKNSVLLQPIATKNPMKNQNLPILHRFHFRSYLSSL